MATEALARTMPHDRVRFLRHWQAVAHVTWLPSTLLLARLVPTERLAPQAIIRRGLATIMAIFRQSPFQFGHPPLQLLNLVSQGGIFHHISQQLSDLLKQHGIFRFQLGDAFFYTHGPILAALAIPYLCNYNKIKEHEPC